jgi:hypothetical protein
LGGAFDRRAEPAQSSQTLRDRRPVWHPHDARAKICCQAPRIIDVVRGSDLFESSARQIYVMSMLQLRRRRLLCDWVPAATRDSSSAHLGSALSLKRFEGFLARTSGRSLKPH